MGRREDARRLLPVRRSRPTQPRCRFRREGRGSACPTRDRSSRSGFFPRPPWAPALRPISDILGSSNRRFSFGTHCRFEILFYYVKRILFYRTLENSVNCGRHNGERRAAYRRGEEPLSEPGDAARPRGARRVHRTRRCVWRHRTEPPHRHEQKHGASRADDADERRLSRARRQRAALSARLSGAGIVRRGGRRIRYSDFVPTGARRAAQAHQRERIPVDHRR